MTPVLVLLVGLPGTGKHTIGSVLVRRLTADGRQVCFVDNHHVTNPILSLVAQDGVSPLPQGLWDRVAEVRTAVLRTVEELSPPDWSFVFTVDLEDEEPDRAFVQRLADIAVRRGASFHVVRLLCDLAELRRRIVTPSRRDRLKSVSEADAVERHAAGVPALADWAPLTLDVTALRPDDAAACVQQHVT